MRGRLVNLLPDLAHKRRQRKVDMERETGLSAMTIHNAYKDPPSYSLKTLTIFCGTLNCQPNDLLLFVPEEE